MTTQKPYILVVDDTEALREEIELMLQLEGFGVWTASNGVEALAVLEECFPDLILCDVMMPDMDGHQLAEEVRSRPAFTMVPFVFVSALSSREQIRYGMEVGADDYVPKPFTAQELLGAVRSRLSRAAALKANVDEKTASLQDQLVRAQKQELIGQLAGGIVHDFNNLITVISTYANLAQSSGDDSAQLHEDLEEIRRASGKAAGLSRRILDLIREREREIIDLELPTLITELIAMLSRVFPKNIIIETSWAPGLPTVLADKHEMEQVFLNLIINSRDAMPNGGSVRLSAERAERLPSVSESEVGASEFLCVTVADDGPGIPTEARDKVFDAFYSTKEVGQSTGLGLATARRLVEASGGHLELGASDGDGAVFHVYLPIGEPAT